MIYFLIITAVIVVFLCADSVSKVPMLTDDALCSGGGWDMDEGDPILDSSYCSVEGNVAYTDD